MHRWITAVCAASVSESELCTVSISSHLKYFGAKYWCAHTVVFLTGALCGAYTVVGTAVLVSGRCACLGGEKHATLLG